MRITLQLDNALLAQAKREAAKRGETLTSLIESGMRLALANAASERLAAAIDLPVAGDVGPDVSPGNPPSPDGAA
jgi:hypothetical protein